jgi:hypothetical protein
MLGKTKELIILMTAILLLFFKGYSQEKLNIKDKTLQEALTEMTLNYKEQMREEIELINFRLSDNEINNDQAEDLKKEVALKYAKKIKEDTKSIEFAYQNYSKDERYVLRIGGSGVVSVKSKNQEIKDSIAKTKVRDIRTYSAIVLAFGFNNVIEDGKSLNDSQFEGGGSRFFEIGYAWKTRVFENSNWLRFKYGLSLQYNNFRIKDNQYYVEDGNLNRLEVFPEDLKKSKIRFTNLVAPIHFEIGPSKKIERENYFRYRTHKKFKIGLGGYAGVRIATKQKLKYSIDGDKKKEKIESDFNANDFICGLSGYVSWGRVGLYGKYEITPLFGSPNIELNNVALGLRFDMD